MALDHIKSPVQTIVCSSDFQNNQFRIVVTVFFKYSVSRSGGRNPLRLGPSSSRAKLRMPSLSAQAVHAPRHLRSTSTYLNVCISCITECLTSRFALLDYVRRAVTDFISRLDVKRRRRRLAVQSTDVATIEGWWVRIPAGIVYNFLCPRLSGGPAVV